jgi:hypothetical protein
MDTLKFHDRLIEAQFTEAQARAIVEGVSADLVTKDYLDLRIHQLEIRIIALITTYTVIVLGSIYFVLPRLPAR